MNEFREIRTGVYFLCKNQEVVYVGQSWDVLRRIDEHSNSKDFDSVLLISVPEHLLFEAEQYWIERIKPRLNAAYRTEPKAENELDNKWATATVAKKIFVQPMGWGDEKEVAYIFGIKGSVLRRLADTDRIISKWIKKKPDGRRRMRIYHFQSIRDMIEACPS